MNTTGIHTTTPLWSVYCYSVLAFAIVLANGLLIIVIGRTRELHTNPNIYVFALGVADLCVGLVATPLILVVGNIEFTELPQVCLAVLSLYLQQSLLPISVLSLLALDRCLFIMRPLRYCAIATKVRAIAALTTASIGVFLWSFAPLFGWNKLALGLIKEEDLKCYPTYLETAYHLLITIIIIALLESVQIICFSFIAHAAWRQRKKINGMRTTQPHPNRPHISVRATIVLALLVFTSAGGWIPGLIIVALKLDWANSGEVQRKDYTGQNDRDVFLFVFVFVGFSTSLINPIVYGFGTPAVKDAALKMFRSPSGTEAQVTNSAERLTTAL